MRKALTLNTLKQSCAKVVKTCVCLEANPDLGRSCLVRPDLNRTSVQLDGLSLLQEGVAERSSEQTCSLTRTQLRLIVFKFVGATMALYMYFVAGDRMFLSPCA
eukprot:4227930-Amphidinium_carterae.1